MNYELIRRLAARTDATVIAWGGSQMFLPLFLPYALLRSLLLPKGRRPDVIYLGDALLAPLGLALKRLLRRPVAVTAHGRDLTFRFPLYRTKIGFCLRRLDRVIGVSGGTTELSLAMGIPPDRCFTIRNGVDPASHAPSEDERAAARRWLDERGVTADRPLVITVGRLVKRKGIAVFIELTLPILLRGHPGLVYLAVGEGRERKAIEAAARGVPAGAVLIPGRLPHPLVRGLMGSADVFVMPNIAVPGDVEGFGLVALEAGCAGLPVVASDLEGIRDAIEDGGNGFLVPPGRPEQFAAAVGRLLSDRGQRKEAGRRARDYNARRHSWDARAAEYLDALRALCPG